MYQPPVFNSSSSSPFSLFLPFSSSLREMAVANHCWEEAKVTSCQQRAAHSTQKRPQKGPKKTQKIHLFLFCNHPQNRGILRKYTCPFFALTTKKEIFCSRPVEEFEPNMCCKEHHRPAPVQSREKVNEYCLHCLVLVVYFTSSKLNFRYTAFALCVLTHIS